MLLVPEDACSIPACGGCTVCPCTCKDDLWWPGNPSFGGARITVVNPGERNVVAKSCVDETTIHRDCSALTCPCRSVVEGPLCCSRSKPRIYFKAVVSGQNCCFRSNRLVYFVSVDLGQNCFFMSKLLFYVHAVALGPSYYTHGQSLLF